MMKTLAAAAVAILLGMGLSCPATAQLNELARAGLDLTDKDWELLEAAASKLYLTEDQPVGAVETWSNAESGNRGKIELVRVGDFQQMPCRRLQHEIKMKDAADLFRFTVDRCRTSGGEWKVL
ncbi:MAG TPA: hypothetical protein VIR45_05500 [Kiloniellaceae bacterium]